MNFVGVMVGGIAVAYALVELLPAPCTTSWQVQGYECQPAM